MPEYGRFRSRTLGERVYSGLLRLYPRDFRDEFGDAMAEFYRDRMARARRDPRLLASLRMWFHVVADAAVNAVPARIDSIVRTLRRRRDQRRAIEHAPSLAPLRREDRMLSTIGQDARFTLRGMRRTPGFSLIVLATLAIGIGASVSIFSVVNGVLLKALPFPEPDRLVRIEHLSPSTASEPEFVDYRRDLTSITQVSAYRAGTATLAATDGEPERVPSLLVSEDFFPALGVRMALGRAFTDHENRRGGPEAIVISDGLWRRRYGGDSSIVGRQVVVNGESRTVVGVLPPGVEFPSRDIALWVPMRLNYDSLWTRNNHYLSLVGRLGPGVALERANLEVRELVRRFVRDYPAIYDANDPLVARVSSLSSVMVRDARASIMLLFGAVLLVLLIACVNVANLLLARGEARRKELAIRTAMGASRARVVRQALTESLLFAGGGGLLGLGLAMASVNAFRAAAPPGVPRMDTIAIDPGVLLFAVGLTALTGLLFGAVPAWRAARHDAAEALKESGRSSGGNAQGAGRARCALVASEIALALVTLSAAGLLLRSFANLNAIDLGFRAGHVLAVSLTPPQAYTDDRAVQLYEDILQRVRALPGVEAASAVEYLPIADGYSIWSILVDGAPMTTSAQAQRAMPQRVTPGYFETMRIPVIRGRGFTAADRVDAPLVVVINEAMAKEYWPGKDPIGGTVKMLNERAPWATVVGVVKDVRSRGFLETVPSTMYFPQAQSGLSSYFVPSTMWVLTRTRGAPAAIAASVRAIVREVEPNTPIGTVMTMDDAVAESVASRRFTTALIGGFALIAIVLAGLGIYGVISYSVSQRRIEMGIRLALGATRQNVVGQVIGEGVRTVAVGVGIGVAITVGTTRLLRAMLVGVGPGDPATLVSVIALLLLVAIVASWLPARRASGVDPVEAIRAE